MHIEKMLSACQTPLDTAGHFTGNIEGTPPFVVYNVPVYMMGGEGGGICYVDTTRIYLHVIKLNAAKNKAMAYWGLGGGTTPV